MSELINGCRVGLSKGQEKQPRFWIRQND